jgi:hypothetical protein
MSKEARLAAARERVKRWKADKVAHGWSLKQQWLRRYARQKAQRRERNIEWVKLVPKTEGRQYERYGETERGDIEWVDVPYVQMEPKMRGGHGRTSTSMGQAGEPGVARADGEGLGGSEQTANEEATYRRLGELRSRQAAGKLNAAAGPGVEIEVEL